MKIKTTKKDVIDSTRFFNSTLIIHHQVIEGICKTHRLTQDFIKEFAQYITPEMFMMSFRLSKELADNNPDLFDEVKFKELLKYKEEEIDNPNATENQKSKCIYDST